jgi:glycosyltransferase involved in cell wall biosynthesis
LRSCWSQHSSLRVAQARKGYPGAGDARRSGTGGKRDNQTEGVVMSGNAFGPLVSIVIPVYNGSNFLAQAIDSALAQTYGDFEVIVVNDGSNDRGKTRDIALSYGDRIRYFEKENGGVATALNLGIEKMKGEFFSWLSHDDRYLPNKLDEQIRYLQKNNLNRVVLYSRFEVIDADSNYLRTRPKVNHFEPFKLCLVSQSPIHGCSLLVPRECFEICGSFNPEWHYAQDYDLWNRIAAKFTFKHLPTVLIQSREHDGQDSVAKKSEAFEESKRLSKRSIDEIFETIPLDEIVFYRDIVAEGLRACCCLPEMAEYFLWRIPSNFTPRLPFPRNWQFMMRKPRNHLRFVKDRFKSKLKAIPMFARLLPYWRNPRLLPSLPREIAKKCLVALGMNPIKVRTFFGFNANRQGDARRLGPSAGNGSGDNCGVAARSFGHADSRRTPHRKNLLRKS